MFISARLTIVAVIPFLSILIISSAQVATGTQLWMYDAGNPILSSPALAADETVYFGAGGNLYAVTNGGSNKWVFAMGGGQCSAPAVGRDGTVYIANTSAGYLYAVNADGSQKWRYPAQAGTGSPAIGPDNTIYIHGYHMLHAVSTNGTLLWTNRIGGEITFTSPSIAPDGTIYVSSPDVRTLYAINSDGTQRWQTGVVGSDSPAIGADGTIYVTGNGLSAYSPDGTNSWVNQPSVTTGTSVAVANDGTIYVAAQTLFNAAAGYGFTLYALDRNGNTNWQYGKAFFSNLFPTYAPAIDSAGVVYYAGFDTLFAFAPNGNILWTFSTHAAPGDQTSYSWTSTAIGPSGAVYVTFGSRLYAFAGTNALGNTAWPMYRQNARHTGKLEKSSLKQPQKRSDANFQFELFPQQLGLTYTIETSTNLNTWTSLTSIVATMLPTAVADLTATNAPFRFYRASSSR